MTDSDGYIDKKFRKLELNDFFQRKEINETNKLVSDKIYNSVVAITGAGGSIGSKLTEKVLINNPINFFGH